jgi:hypothetical protein
MHGRECGPASPPLPPNLATMRPIKAIRSIPLAVAGEWPLHG